MTKKTEVIVIEMIWMAESPVVAEPGNVGKEVKVADEVDVAVTAAGHEELLMVMFDFPQTFEIVFEEQSDGGREQYVIEGSKPIDRGSSPDSWFSASDKYDKFLLSPKSGTGPCNWFEFNLEFLIRKPFQKLVCRMFFVFREKKKEENDKEKAIWGRKMP